MGVMRNSSMSGDSWTTAGVPDEQVPCFWRDCVDRALLELDINVDVTGSGFAGTLRSRPLGRMQVTLMTVDRTQTMCRTPAIISRCSRPGFVLMRMRAGRGSLRHGGGEAPLRTDECVLLDSREPFELTVSGYSEILYFHLPIDWVETHLPDPQAAVAVPLGGTQPWNGLLREVMDAIQSDCDSPFPFLVARTLCTALALAAPAIEVRSTLHSRKTFKSLQRTLAGQASTCNVTAGETAQAHGISLRYLHAIYCANGTSYGRELIRLRLERAQRLLLDPMEPGRSIEDIAWQCGFSDPSHFRRRFRALFGSSPSAIRTDSSRLAHTVE